MPTFSIIIPTVGRTEELAKMLASLNEQQGASFEVILVDQNDDDRLQPLLSLLDPSIPVHHLRPTRKNISNARNVGLRQATGDFVAFPDDDCWYPPQLLPQVEAWFAKHPEYAILAVGANDEEGLISGNRWPADQCDIRPFNSLRTTFSNSLFLKRAALPKDIVFDDTMLSSEETDFILRILRTGVRGRFDRSLHIGHPRRDMLSGTVTPKRAMRYGEGMGQLVRKHSLFFLWAALLGYDLARFVVVSAKGRFQEARFCLAHTLGLFRGFIFPQATA